MNKHLQNIHNVKMYLNKAIAEIDNGLTVVEKVDLLGNMDNIAKILKEYIDTEKKLIPVEKELKGNEFKIKKSISVNTEINPETLYQEIHHNDFLKCCKIVTQRVTAFLPKQKIEEIKEVTGETERFTFESI